MTIHNTMSIVNFLLSCGLPPSQDCIRKMKETGMWDETKLEIPKKPTLKEINSAYNIFFKEELKNWEE